MTLSVWEFGIFSYDEVCSVLVGGVRGVRGGSTESSPQAPVTLTRAPCIRHAV
jgi:hypothetical protein